MGTYSNLIRASSVSLPAKPQNSRQEVTALPSASEENIEAAPTTERKTERTIFRTENRTVTLPLKRKTKRYSFEFYEDQLTQLKKLKYEAEMSGENLSLSDIVRTALDDFLAEKNSR